MHNPKDDKAYFTALKAALPSTIEVVERPLHAEDPAFVEEAVDRLIGLIERSRQGMGARQKAPRP